jgi:hypothetical protein
LLDKFQDATGAEAKKLGKTIDGLNVKEWDKNSSKVMKDLLLESFKQNPDALAKLLATGNATLTHKYGGVEQDKGRFSKLLMQVRNELKVTQPQVVTQDAWGNLSLNQMTKLGKLDIKKDNYNSWSTEKQEEFKRCNNI